MAVTSFKLTSSVPLGIVANGSLGIGLGILPWARLPSCLVTAASTALGLGNWVCYWPAPPLAKV